MTSLLLVLAAMVLGGAQAASPVLSAGVEASFNDPFIQTRGLRLGASLPVAPHFAVGVVAGGYPSPGSQDLKTLTTQLIDDYQITPDLSRLRARALAEAQVTLLEQTLGARSRALGLHAGLGAVYTVDDEDALQAQGDPVFLETQKQIHPMWAVGVSGETWWDGVGARLRMDFSSYTEVVMSTIEEDRKHAWIAAEVLWRLP